MVLLFKLNFEFQVEGLCGNFDSDINNEFIGRSGLPMHKTKFAEEFISPACFSPQRDELEAEPCSVNVNVSLIFFIYSFRKFKILKNSRKTY